MKNIKRILCAVICLVLILCAAFPASAVDVANRKSSLSKFAGKGKLTATVEKLHSFDDMNGVSGSGSIDTGNKKEGSGSYSYTFRSEGHQTVVTANGFSADASRAKKMTFRMWVFISDMTLLKCDHEAGYPDNDYSNSGTIFFRFQSAGGNWAINQTIEGKGWQMCEFTLDHDNGASSSFDPTRISGMFLQASGRAGLTIKVDGLEVVYYNNDGYTDDNSTLPAGATLISNCEYDGLAGEVITEWYNSDFSTEDPKQGKSSLVLKVDGTDDNRAFWGGLNLPVSLDDYLCFWFKTDNIKAMGLTGHIEINEIQDNLEYQTDFKLITTCTVEKLENDKWNLVMIPVKKMKFNYPKDYTGDTVNPVLNIHHLRLVPSGTGEGVANVYFDQIFTMKSADAINYKRQLLGIGNVSSVTEEISSVQPTDDDSESSDGLSVGAIVGIVVGVVAVAAVIIIVASLASKKKTAAPTEEPKAEEPKEE